jgi:hypothetical protein
VTGTISLKPFTLNGLNVLRLQVWEVIVQNIPRKLLPAEAETLEPSHPIPIARL